MRDVKFTIATSVVPCLMEILVTVARGKLWFSSIPLSSACLSSFTLHQPITLITLIVLRVDIVVACAESERVDDVEHLINLIKKRDVHGNYE